MAVNASVLTGSTNLMAMSQPSVGPTAPYGVDKDTGLPYKVQGVPIMIDVRTREIITIDPWLLKRAGIINSAFGIALGPKGQGKSSLLKIIANRLCLLTAGYDMMRVSINDYKPEGALSEYALFTQHMRSVVFRIASMRVNPLEARLFMDGDDGVYELAIIRIAEIIFEFANGVRPSGANAEAVRTAVAKMLRYDAIFWAPELLFNCLRTLTDEDIQYYQSELMSKLASQMQARLEHKLITSDSVKYDLTNQLHAIGSDGVNLRYEEIKQAGIYMSQQLGNILHGSYGSMLGVDHSLYGMLTERVSTKDWRGVPPDAEALMRLVLTEIKVAAVENGRTDLLPHIELDDEQHKSMNNIVYAKSHSHFSEIARGTHTCNLSATHRFSSIRRGGVGSELYGLGDTIIQNLGFAFIGKHEAGDPGIAEIVERYSLSQTDKLLIPDLPEYTFGVKLGDVERIRYGRVFALPSEMKFLGTDSATDRMVDRPGIMNPEQIARFARENGIVHIGAETLAA